MNLADLVVIGYGVLAGFALGVTVCAAIVIRTSGCHADAGHADRD